MSGTAFVFKILSLLLFTLGVFSVVVSFLSLDPLESSLFSAFVVPVVGSAIAFWFMAGVLQLLTEIRDNTKS